MILNVLYQSSSLYAIPAGISIFSLLDNNKDIEHIHIWFVDVGLKNEDKTGLTELVNRFRRTITFLTGDAVDHLLSENGVEKWSGSYATFYKIFNCSRLLDVDSVLYIDSDTIVLGSLMELCEYDFEDNACAMVGSGMTGTVKKFLDIKNYYNAGIILFNLKYWREHNIEQEFVNAVKSNRCVVYTMIGDESLINKVLCDRIKRMPLKYNYETTWWLWGWNKKLYNRLGFDQEAYYDFSEIREARERPCIAHYVDLTTGRPWDRGNDNPFRKEFEYYFHKMKPWKQINMPIRGIGAKNRVIWGITNLVKRLIPFSLRSRIGFAQHDSFWMNRIKELS